MSLDYNFIENKVWEALSDYTNCEQIVVADQTIPLDKLKMPRIVFKLSQPYGTINTNIEELREAVPSENPNFDEDMLHTFITKPRVTLSITGYGTDVRQIRPYIEKARDFFLVHKLGGYFFEKIYNGAINKVTDTQDRTSILENEYQKRIGFDVILDFEDKIEVRHETIESIDLLLNEENKELDT